MQTVKLHQNHQRNRLSNQVLSLGSGLFILLFLSGCYTQLVALERPHGGLDQVVADYGDDGDVVVRKYYDDGYVDEDVYDSYDWYNHEPYLYSQYFDSFYGFGYSNYNCWDMMYCNSLAGYYNPGWNFSLGFGRPYGYGYSSFGFGYGGYGGYGYNGYGYGGFGGYGGYGTITTVMAICIMAAFQWLEAIMAPVVLPWPEAR
jgi:hypothetical protein